LPVSEAAAAASGVVTTVGGIADPGVEIADKHDGTDIRIGTPVTGDETSGLVVRASEDLSRIRERGVGISDIVISTSAGKRNTRQLGHHGIASTIWIA
jgi:hypothetical protein